MFQVFYSVLDEYVWNNGLGASPLLFVEATKTTIDKVRATRTRPRLQRGSEPRL